jgi:hypothetical protein
VASEWEGSLRVASRQVGLLRAVAAGQAERSRVALRQVGQLRAGVAGQADLVQVALRQVEPLRVALPQAAPARVVWAPEGPVQADPAIP